MEHVDQVARSAAEWLAASGARTPERLADLVEHYAGTYGLAPDALGLALEEARAIARRRHLLA